MKYIAIITALLFVGCSEITEETRRNGRPGDSGYIAPHFVEVEIVKVVPFHQENVGSMYMYTKDHVIVQSEDRKRYEVLGHVGEVGDKFMLDISLLKPIGS